MRLYLLASSQVWRPSGSTRAASPRWPGGFLNTLKNTYRFFALYAGELGARRPARDAPRSLARPLDAGRLDGLVEAVDDGVGGVRRHGGRARRSMDFVVDDLSNWYVRLNRGRASGRPTTRPIPAAVATLHDCLVTVARLLAPGGPVRVRLAAPRTDGPIGASCRVPGRPAAARDAALEAAMDAVRRLASPGAGRPRDEEHPGAPAARPRCRWPCRRGTAGRVFDELLTLLQPGSQRAGGRGPVASDADLVRLQAKPNFRALGKRFGKRHAGGRGRGRHA